MFVVRIFLSPQNLRRGDRRLASDGADALSPLCELPRAAPQMTDPANGFYVTGGAMSVGAASYVERTCDAELRTALMNGEFCCVLTPSQMGKTSLMARTAAELSAAGLLGGPDRPDGDRRQCGLRTVVLRAPLRKVGTDLELKENLLRYWKEQSELAPLRRWFGAIREVVLPACPGPVVIFIDEIGVVAKLPFSTDEFFAGIRECYHRRGEDKEFARLTFCLLGVATPSDLIRDRARRHLTSAAASIFTISPKQRRLHWRRAWAATNG